MSFRTTERNLIQATGGPCMLYKISPRSSFEMTFGQIEMDPISKVVEAWMVLFIS
jgi:hypothetical protein